MAKINSNASDKENNSALEKTSAVLGSLSLTTDPVVITAVQRKANIGNFETIDIYMAVAIPQPGLDVTDAEALSEALAKAAETGFTIASRETSQRYKLIKESTR
jgi:hypothetical protein